jgi:DNA-binding transcriptional ArsR family regulator
MSDIVLPVDVHELDYELEAEVHADTPARLKAASDPLRMLILDLVLEQAMTVTDLAERIGRPRGTVAHHVNVLVDAGLLRVVRTRKVRALEERFYGRSARTILFPDGVSDGDLPFVADARRVADMNPPEGTPSFFTMRSVRIPAELAEEFSRRLLDLALEFSGSPRGGEREFAMLLGLFPTTRPVAPRRPRDGS